MATLQDALNNVACLKTLALPDEQPTIEPEAASVVYEVSFDTNFADRTAFITGIGKYNEEATVCSNLNVILDEGDSYAGLLYTWRSLSRAVPAIKTHEQSNRMEIYEKTVQVLGPEIRKAKELMRFVQDAATRFCNEVKTLAHPERRKDFISETYLLTLAKLVNMFATLDALKNMKACINNDLACHKRAEGILNRGNIDAFAMEESQSLSIFFANNNSITQMLKKYLEEVSGYEDVLVETINICCHYYENNMYMVPKEKYMLLKAIGYGLVLMDGNVVNINKLKKLNLVRIDRLFRSLPVAPLYGDVQIRFADWVRKLTHFDPSKWPCATEHMEEKATVAIQTRVETIRSEHVRFISDLARYNNEIITSSNFSLNDQTSKELTEIGHQGIKLLTSWTTAVMELYSWKLLHPTNEYDNKECPKDAEAYERATRYNYSREEKYSLVEIIGMIKGLSLLMHRMEQHFAAGIRRHIYLVVQQFVQISIRESLRKVIKNKKLQTKTVLLAIRDVCIDWLDGKERHDDPALRGEKDPKSGFHIQVPRRTIGLSSTQLYMMRTMLESLLSDKAGKKALRSELREGSLPEFEAFHKSSFFFGHLLNFGGTLRVCCDLSQLWFREFYLELTMGERIQFPIEMSLPWILTNQILQNKEAHMMEYILYPLDLYSDSAHYSLHHFKKQFLYDEIEAEVNLCFDQLVYKLSEQIFQYYKHLAASIYLDKRFRMECAPNKFPHPSPNRYETILKQRHVQLLGRSIDLNALLTQRLSSSLIKAIDVAISKFEANDLCSIVELEVLLEINRLTHKLLSEHTCLDPFEALFREVNQSVSSPHGRVTLHIFWELHYDFLPNFCYNSTTDRFIRGKVSFADQSERENPPRGSSVVNLLYGSKDLRNAYSSIVKLFEGFVGPTHFRVMSRFLGYQGIAMILEQLLHITDGQMNNTLKPYIAVLMQGMPQKCRKPRYEYGSKGVLGFYQAQLTPVVTYRDLQTDVFQAFKEIGNTVIFCLQLEKALGQEEVMDLLQAAPFQNMYPRPFVKEDQSAEIVMQQMDQQYAPLHLVSMVTKYGTELQAANAKDSDLLTKERLCRALSMFEVVMQRFKVILQKESQLWEGPTPVNGVMSVDECQEFHRLWSAIQFAFCVPPTQGQITIEEWCGEGLQWAGLTVITLLGQQKRFEALDFCYHLLHVHDVDRQEAELQGVSLKRFVERVKVFKQLNNQIFGILNKHLASSEVTAMAVREFQPPIY